MAQRASSCVLRVRFKLWNTGQEKFKMDLLLKLGNRFWSSPKYVTIKKGQGRVITPLYNKTTWRKEDTIQSDGNEVHLDIDVTGWVKHNVTHYKMEIDGDIVKSDIVSVAGCGDRPVLRGVSDKDSPSSLLMGLIGLVVTVTVVVLAVAAVFVIRRRVLRRQPVSNTKPNDQENSLPILSTPEEDKSIPVGGIVREIRELRSSKKLLLVFSYDCPQHAYAVYRLCIYLMCRCGCDVSWTLPVAEMEGCHSEEWLLKQINVSDCVLILNSEPAYQRYTTRKNNLMESNNDPAGGDMFLQAIDLIKTKFVYNISSQGRHKFFMVTFPYASPAHLIPGLKDKLRTFQLMQDIGSLFMAIHGLPESHSDQRTYGKDINDKDYVKCAEGLGLRNAIETVEALPKATEDTSDSDSLSSWPSECSSCSDEDIWAQDNDQFLL